MKSLLIALCGAALIAAPRASAADDYYSSHRDLRSRELSHADRRFLTKSAQGSTNEVALSRLAVERARDPRIRELARRMIRDHEDLNGKVRDLAGRRNVDITEAVQKGQEEDVDSLSRKSAEDFDRAYLDAMVKGHKDTIELFENAAADSQDPGIAALAANALPTILEHYRHARDLARHEEDSATPPLSATPPVP